MTTVSASDAEKRFRDLLDDVERGDEVTITREGKPVARIVPVAGARPERTPEEQARIREAIEEIRKFRRGKRISAEEIREMIHEGHKY